MFLSPCTRRRGRFLRVALPVCVAGFSLVFSVHAQTPLPDSAVLRGVVIQATRADARNPTPHTNLDAEQLARAYHAQDVPFLLGGVPSLVETSDAGAGIGYTGMRIRGSDQTRINVTLNGVPLNDAESQNVFWVDLPDLAASAAEIQVQRGVGGSTNGAGAFGATVNIDLSRVEPQPFAVLSNTVGAFNTRKHSAYLGTGLLHNRLAFSGRLSHIASDGFIDRAEARLNSLHLTGTYIDDRQSLQLQLLSGHERTYQAWYGVPAQYVDDPALRTYNVAGTERPGGPYDDEVDDYTQRHHLLHYKRLLGHGLSLQLNGHYTRGYGFYEQYKADENLADYGFPADSLRPDLVRRRWLDNHFYGITYALRWKPPVNPPLLAGGPELLLGGAVSRYEGRHFGKIIWSEYAFNVPKDALYYDNSADKRDANVFLKIQTDFNSGLSTFIDLQYRYVWYNFLGFDPFLQPVDQTVDLHFFNPKLGFSWKLNPLWTTYGFFGVGNREPNRDDFTQSTPASRPRPERLYNLETGLRAQGAHWQASANVFGMYYRDQLVLDGRINDVGAYIRTNIPDSYRAGVELEAALQAGRRWTFSGNAAFSRNTAVRFVEFRDNWDSGGQERIEHRNTDLAFSPAFIGRAEASVQVLPVAGRRKLDFSLIGKYVGKQYLDNTSNENAALPGYFFADLRANFNWRLRQGQELRLIATVHNVLDARFSSNGWTYRYVSAGYDARPDDPYTRLEGGAVYNQTGFFPQAGRHWMVSVVLGI